MFSYRRPLGLLTVVVLGLLASPAAAQSVGSTIPPEMLPGFKPNGVYDTTPVDRVNVFSGELALTVPLGPRYTLAPGLDWGLSASYSSKFWDQGEKYCAADCVGNPNPCEAEEDPGMRGHVYAMGDPTLGLGWRLHLGYVGIEGPGLGEGGGLSYVSSDGAAHPLLEVGANLWETVDGSRIRVSLTGTTYRVEYPDGTSAELAHGYAPPGPIPSVSSPDLNGDNVVNNGSHYGRTGLTKLYDRFGREVLSVSYTGTVGQIASITLQPVSAGTSRSIVFHWTTLTVAHADGDPDPTYSILSSIDFPTFAHGTTTRTQTLTFSIVGGVLLRPTYYVLSTNCADYANVKVPFLEGITLGGSGGEEPLSWTFAYTRELSPEPDDDVHNGTLSELTLPTGGRVGYQYDITARKGRLNGADTEAPVPYVPNPLPNDLKIIMRSIDESPAVVSRTESDPVTGLSSTTTYQRHYVYGGGGDVHTRAFRRTLVRTPDGNGGFVARRHMFTSGVTGEGGLEVERRLYETDYSYPTDPGVEPETQPASVQTTVRCFAGDRSVNDYAGPTICGYLAPDGELLHTGLDRNVRLFKEVTFYAAQPTGGTDCSATTSLACRQRLLEEWDAQAGEYEKETTTVASGSELSSRLVPPSWTSKVVLTRYVPLIDGTHWLPKLVAFRREKESYAGACPAVPCEVVTRFCWNEYGALTSEATFDSVADPLPCGQYPAGTDYLERSLGWTGASDPEGVGLPKTESLSTRTGSTALTGSATTTRSYTLSGQPLTSQRTDIGWKGFDVDRENALGLVTTSRDANGLVTVYTYDSFGRVTGIAPPGGDLATTIRYKRYQGSSLPYVLVKRGSTDAQALSDTNVIGTVEAYQYDGFGRILRRVRKLPNTLSTGSRYAVQRITYNALGAVASESEWAACPIGTGTDAQHDLSNCLTHSPSDRTTWSSFDPLGRPTLQALPDGSTVTTSYTDSPDSGSGASLEHSESVRSVARKVDDDALATPPRAGVHVTSRARTDVFGRLIRVFEPSASGLGYETEYRYNVLGKLGRVEQKGATTNQVRLFEHDVFGFLRREVHPEVEGAVRYDEVNALGKVGKQTQRNASDAVVRTWDRTFDALGRETQVKVDGVEHLVREYDTAPASGACGPSNLPNGRLSRSVSWNRALTGQPSVEDVYCYADGAGRLTKVRDVGRQAEQTYGYTSLGLLATESYPRDYGVSGPTLVATTSYRNGLPVGLSFTEGGLSTPVVASATYHPTGGLASVVLGGSRGGSRGVVETIEEGFLGRPSRILATTRLGGTTLFDTGTILYDGSGNLTRMTGGSLEGPHELRYDALSRLTEATYRTKYASTADGTVEEKEEFGYDRYGNLTSRRVDGEQTAVGVSLATNRLTDAGWGYDAYGQVTAEPIAGGSRTVTWDGLLRQAKTDDGGGKVVQYLYDARGERRTRRGPTEVLVPSATSTRFHTVTPCRLLDTRPGEDPWNQPPVMEDQRPRTIDAWESCGVPRQARALAVNLTTVPAVTAAVTPPAIRGVEHHPADVDRGKAIANAVNASGQTRAAQTIVGLSAETGRYTLFPTLGTGGRSHVIVDVAGYFLPEPPGGGTTDFVTYRGAGGQVVREVRLDGGQTLAQATTYTDRLWFGGRLVATKEKGGKTKLVVTDHLGSPRVVTAATEEVLSVHRYETYGSPRGSAEAERGTRFASMEYDAETSRFYDHARYYTATLGRFTSPDSVNGDPEDPRTFNRYQYSFGNPLKYVDPDGRLVRFASDLPQKDVDRYVTALARARRDASFARRFDSAVCSRTVTTLSVDSFPNDYLLKPVPKQPGIKFGHTNMEPTVKPRISLVIDFANIDYSATTPERDNNRVTDVEVVAHEFDHTNNMLTPEGIDMINASAAKKAATGRDPEEDAARAYGRAVATNPETAAPPTALELEDIRRQISP